MHSTKAYAHGSLSLPRPAFVLPSSPLSRSPTITCAFSLSTPRERSQSPTTISSKRSLTATTQSPRTPTARSVFHPRPRSHSPTHKSSPNTSRTVRLQNEQHTGPRVPQSTPASSQPSHQPTTQIQIASLSQQLLTKATSPPDTERRSCHWDGRNNTSTAVSPSITPICTAETLSTSEYDNEIITKGSLASLLPSVLSDTGSELPFSTYENVTDIHNQGSVLLSLPPKPSLLQQSTNLHIHSLHEHFPGLSDSSTATNKRRSAAAKPRVANVPSDVKATTRTVTSNLYTSREDAESEPALEQCVCSSTSASNPDLQDCVFPASGAVAKIVSSCLKEDSAEDGSGVKVRARVKLISKSN